MREKPLNAQEERESEGDVRVSVIAVDGVIERRGEEREREEYCWDASDSGEKERFDRVTVPDCMRMMDD